MTNLLCWSSWEMLISVLDAAMCASILFCIPSTGPGLLRNEAASSAWSICPRKGRQISQSPLQCDRWPMLLFPSDDERFLSSQIGNVTLCSLEWRVDHISSAVSNRSPSSPARAGSWAWKQFVWTCSASFGCTWDFGICLACMLERFKWQIMNRCLGEKDMEK